MAVRMGVKEFREKFTTIAREATGPVIVTSHGKVVGYYTPSRREPLDVKKWFAEFDETAKKLRADAEARGIDVAAKLKELGIEDDKPFDDPWTDGNPGRSDDEDEG